MKRLLLCIVTALLATVGLSVAAPAAHAATTCMSGTLTVGPRTVTAVCSEWEWALVGSSKWIIGLSGPSTNLGICVNGPGVYVNERVMPGDLYVNDMGQQGDCTDEIHSAAELTSGTHYTRVTFQYRDPSNNKLCRAYMWQDRYTITKQHDPLPCDITG